MFPFLLRFPVGTFVILPESENPRNLPLSIFGATFLLPHNSGHPPSMGIFPPSNSPLRDSLRWQKTYAFRLSTPFPPLLSFFLGSFSSFDYYSVLPVFRREKSPPRFFDQSSSPRLFRKTSLCRQLLPARPVRVCARPRSPLGFSFPGGFLPLKSIGFFFIQN